METDNRCRKLLGYSDVYGTKYIQRNAITFAIVNNKKVLYSISKVDANLNTKNIR